MGKRSRKSKNVSPKAREVHAGAGRGRRIVAYAIVSIVSLAIGAAAVMFVMHPSDAPAPSDGSHRSVAQLIALSDAELERVDIVEMNIAVAREIPGLEKLDYAAYRKTVDGWSDQFRRWLPTTEHAFRQAPEKYKNDINFFRLGMLAQFLDQQVGVAYVEQQKADQKRGVKGVWYTNPGHLLLHGLIDTKRGTCGTMPALHVAVGRRLGWPVALACAKSHYVCRYDDGRVVYNIEATDTGRGGFAAGSDSDYMESEGISRKAVSCGSDLRKLTAREMLGVFVQARARHLADTNKPARAARDYALAHTLFPKSRKIYLGLTGNLVAAGERLFTPGEHGHPASLGAYLVGRYRTRNTRRPTNLAPTAHRSILGDTDEFEAMNRRNMQRHKQRSLPPPPPQPYQPTIPGPPGAPIPASTGLPQLPQIRR